MTQRKNELSTTEALNIIFHNKYREVSELKSNISGLENLLRNQKSLLEQQESKLEKIKDAQENKSCTMDDLLNL